MKSIPPPVKISSPCPKRWEEMCGGERKRFCEHCQLHVHDLSAMSNDDRNLFLKTNRDVCVTYLVSADGNMKVPSPNGGLGKLFSPLVLRMTAIFAALLPLLFSSCRVMGKREPKTNSNGIQPTHHSMRLTGYVPDPQQIDGKKVSPAKK